MPRLRLIPSTAIGVLYGLLALACALPLRADLRWAASGRAGWAENLPLLFADQLEGLHPPRNHHRSHLSPRVRPQLAAARERPFDTFTVRDFTLNNTFALGPRFDLQRKFGLGPFAPTLRAHFGLARRDSRLRGADGFGPPKPVFGFPNAFPPPSASPAGYNWIDTMPQRPPRSMSASAPPPPASLGILPTAGNSARRSPDLMVNSSPRLPPPSLPAPSPAASARSSPRSYNARPFSDHRQLRPRLVPTASTARPTPPPSRSPTASAPTPPRPPSDQHPRAQRSPRPLQDQTSPRSA